MTALTGPAPTVERDRWGRPMLPHKPGAKPEPYTRATTIGYALEDQSALMLWKQRMTMLGLVARRDLLTAAAATSPDDKRELNRLAEAAADAGGSTAAASIGTALHAFAERLDRGMDVGHVPEEYQGDMEAYADLGRRLGWKLHGIEQFVVDHTHRIAGTADRVIAIDGRRYIADLKTGASVDYPHGWAVQLAIYAHSLPWDFEAQCTRPWDVPPEVDRGLIIHLPAGRGKATAYWIDLTAGWDVLPLALRVRTWQKRRDLLTPWTPEGPAPDPLTEAIAAATSVDALNALWAANRASWSTGHTRLAAARKEALA